MKKRTEKSEFLFFLTLQNMKKLNVFSFFGFFEDNNPTILVSNPEAIKQITVKDFSHFVNHRDVFDGDHIGLFSSSLIALKDEKWKNMRSTLSPVFTGHKMRLMLELIKEVSQQTVDYLKSLDGSDSGVDVDMKDLFGRFTNDAIATVAFGIKVDSLKDDKNEFFVNGKKANEFSGLRLLKFMIYSNSKSLAKALKLELFDGKTMKFFMKLVLDAIEYRKQNKIVRNDMINMLMEARGIAIDENVSENLKSPQDWTDIEIVAQCFLFFLGGFETTATLLSFTAHEIMENPDVQNKLVQEITEIKESLGDKNLTFEVLNNAKYLDQVISETLRKWPAAPLTDRFCKKSITFKNPDGLGDVTVEEGETIFIPIAGLHRDPKYFENPNVFDPERFSEENKGNIQPFTYMPFGVGPRSCIGSRLALMEAKAILFYLVDDFELLPSPKSTIPLDLTGGGIQLKPKNGFWLKLKKRV